MGRAVDSRNKIPGSSRAADIFFFLPHLRKSKNSAFAKGGAFSCQKKLRIF